MKFFPLSHKVVRDGCDCKGKKASSNICLVLDISYSMAERFTEVIKSVNQFIKIQQEEQKGYYTTFTLLLFGSDIKYYLKNVDLQSVTPLQHRNFTLQNSTSLYDAVGKCLADFADKNNVVMCIVTDGLDNSSKHYSKQSVKNILDTKQKYNGWGVNYLSSHITSFSDGSSLNIQNVISCTQDKLGYNISNQMNNLVSSQLKMQRFRNETF